MKKTICLLSIFCILFLSACGVQNSKSRKFQKKETTLNSSSNMTPSDNTSQTNEGGVGNATAVTDMISNTDIETTDTVSSETSATTTYEHKPEENSDSNKQNSKEDDTPNSTVSNETSASHTTIPQTTSQKTNEEPSSGTVMHKRFKSVEELIDWIHNGKDAPAALFTEALKGLKLDRILIIESVDDTFTLEYVRTFQRGNGWDAQIEYYFINEKSERVGCFVQLEDMRSFVDNIGIHVDSHNLDIDYSNHFKITYRDITVNTEDATVS